MKAFDAIKKRRTIRRFSEKEIPAKTLEKCAEAGGLSPTARNLQPLEFIVVQGKENRQRLTTKPSIGLMETLLLSQKEACGAFSTGKNIRG
ncbi:MAG: nitroreductase family protein, partial [Candidatus ainarchaeum sp.]|nr:nitroreductase family protein [Candidatus ainarchaeum sp.]